MLASYANDHGTGYPDRIYLGDGLFGQCAMDMKPVLITDIPPDTVRIEGKVLRALPRSLVVFPVVFEGQIKAVLGLASLNEFAPAHLTFLELLTDSIGIVLNSIEATMQTEDLLKQSQQLAVELQTRQEELQQSNEQLEQKAQQLAEQNVEMERKNQEIEQARGALEEKAEELALTSRYKSEFLANMSHELRTPLNSILILGQQLGDNAERNLSPKQVEFARTIYGAGTDLLGLISDILDLTKIESGTVTVDAEKVLFASLLDTVKRNFRHEAESRNLAFESTVDQELGKHIITDSKRLQQVLMNLLSNAFKFTQIGGITLRVELATGGWSAQHPTLSQSDKVAAFTVSDSGIGIPPEKQKIIFEAFQQADASTSRKYGGTGLGLAISRELASLLGGEIVLKSVPNEGSQFTLYLPLKYVGPASPVHPSIQAEASRAAMLAGRMAVDHALEVVPDDREEIEPGDSVLLIVEDDPHYAGILADLARQEGFKVLVASRGADALPLAFQFQPVAVCLDVFLPDMLGWTVLNQLKLDPSTRHIPVHIVTLDEDHQHGLSRGAFGFITKPATTDALKVAIRRLRDFAKPRRKRLLITEDNKSEQLGIRELLLHDDIDVEVAETGAQALDAMRSSQFDCMVLDLKLPDMTGFDVLELMHEDEALREIPVVVYTGKELSSEEEDHLTSLARKVVVKGVESPERLLDETALFLHRSISELPLEKREMLERLHRSDELLGGKIALAVDDDVRNIFALSSVLERRGMTVLTASTGREAIDLLESRSDVAVVLMDIMMPEMDGYETIRVIRQNPGFRRLPIVALTAKAMKGDREKCLEAGASDYLAKPVNTDQLLSTVRMWLHR